METSLSFAFGFVLNKASGLSLSSSVTHCEPSVCSTGSLKVDADLVIPTTFQVCRWERGEVAESMTSALIFNAEMPQAQIEWKETL